MTGKAIDQQIRSMLEKAEVEPTDHTIRGLEQPAHSEWLYPITDPSENELDDQDKDDCLSYPCDHCNVAMSARIDRGEEIVSGLADSGATDHIHDADQFNPYLINSKPSSVRFETAGCGQIRAEKEGDMEVSYLNLDHYPRFPDIIDEKLHTVTVKGLGHSPLFSLEKEYRDNGYDVYLAWACALHMLRYLQLNRERGIRFSETTDAPMAFVDASNKDDPTDGKTQYGYSIMWGGPLATKSGKLKHVGINSTYNEYMALHHCIKQVVWTRQLLDEIGLQSFISEPTIVFADNKQANNLCNEDLVVKNPFDSSQYQLTVITSHARTTAQEGVLI